MANRIRGEVPLTLGGRRYTLCLTLGALAELEAALQAGDLAGVALRGGGHDLDDAAVARLPLAGGLDAVSAALGDVLAAAFGELPGGEAPGSANPP